MIQCLTCNRVTVFQFYEGLRVQDLRRLKDMLIVETADMLQAPLFTAEALLRAHGTIVSNAQRYIHCCWLAQRVGS